MHSGAFKVHQWCKFHLSIINIIYAKYFILKYHFIFAIIKGFFILQQNITCYILF